MPPRGGVQCQQGLLLGRLVLGDRPQHRGIGDALDVLAAADAGVEDGLQQGVRHPEGSADDQAERQVQQRPRAGRGVRHGGLIDHGEVDERLPGALRALDLTHGADERLRRGVGDLGRPLRVGVRGGEVDQHRLQRCVGGDRLGQGLGRGVQVELVDDRLEHAWAGRQGDVGGHALLGEAGALKDLGRAVPATDRHEHLGGGGVLGLGQGGRPGSQPHSQQGDQQDRQPVLPEDPEIVFQVQRGSSLSRCRARRARSGAGAVNSTEGDLPGCLPAGLCRSSGCRPSPARPRTGHGLVRCLRWAR